MRIFVLCSGRCGSLSFAKACEHMTNFTVGHESNVRVLGPARLAYADNHIEVDNRLAWMLGRLHNRCHQLGQPLYVHLTRDTRSAALSYARRKSSLLANAFGRGIIHRNKYGSSEEWVQACDDLVRTVNSNIRHFLRDKEHVRVCTETLGTDWPEFWRRSGAKGDFGASIKEWNHRHNASVPEGSNA